MPFLLVSYAAIIFLIRPGKKGVFKCWSLSNQSKVNDEISIKFLPLLWYFWSHAFSEAEYLHMEFWELYLQTKITSNLRLCPFSDWFLLNLLISFFTLVVFILICIRYCHLILKCFIYTLYAFILKWFEMSWNFKNCKLKIN